MVTIPGNVWYTYKPEPENPKEDGCIVPTPTPSSSDEWVRPADRPPLPWGEGELTEDNTIYMLFGVTPNAPNDYAITLTGTSYIATWGDGTSDNYTSGTKAEHIFDYDSIDVTPNANGIKWVWILFKPEIKTGNFISINTIVRHTYRPEASSTSIFVPQVYEIYMRATKVETWEPWDYTTRVRWYNLNILHYYGENKLSSLKYFLEFCINFRKLILYTGNVTDFSYFLSNCLAFNTQLNIDTSKGILFNNFLEYCYSFNQPLNIDTSNATTLSNFIRNCYSFNQPLNINSSNVTNFNNFLSDCFSFNQFFSIDTSKGTTFSSFMNGCRSFNQPININTSKATVAGTLLGACYPFSHSLTLDLSSITSAGSTLNMSNIQLLSGLRISNMSISLTTINISGSSLSTDSLVLLFEDLKDRTGGGYSYTINITNVYGASALTPAQRAIATSKNWTIVG